MFIPIIIATISFVFSYILLFIYKYLRKYYPNKNIFKDNMFLLILSFQESLQKNSVLIILMMMFSKIITDIPEFRFYVHKLNLFPMVYYLITVYSVLSTLRSIKNRQILNEIIYPDKVTNELLIKLEFHIKLKNNEKESAERTLNTLKSVSIIPILLLFINNLGTLKKGNPKLNFLEIIVGDVSTLFILSGILIYSFLIYNAYKKCQTITFQENLLLSQLENYQLQINSSKHRI